MLGQPHEQTEYLKERLRQLQARNELVNGINVELRRKIAGLENELADAMVEAEAARAEVAQIRRAIAADTERLAALARQGRISSTR